MKDVQSVKARYLRDALPIRLGGLAANLSRIKSFSIHDHNQKAVRELITESKYFVEWTAQDTAMEVAEELVDLQVQLARWEYSWEQVWGNPDRRIGMSENAADWSRRVLELSGLL
jgi:hypothetical protein